jgi:hypothetical protein
MDISISPHLYLFPKSHNNKDEEFTSSGNSSYETWRIEPPHTPSSTFKTFSFLKWRC